MNSLIKPGKIDLIGLVPLIGLLGISMLGFGFLFPVDRSVDIEAQGTLKRQLTLSLIFFAAFVVLMRDKEQLLAQVKSNKLLFLLLAFALLSCTWSPVPFISFKRWIQFLGIVLVAMAAMNSVTGRIGIRLLLQRLTALSLMISFVLILIHPSSPFIVNGLWAGLFGMPNHLGRACVLAIAAWLPVFASESDLKRKAIAVFVIALSIALMIGTTRATPVISAVTIFIVYFVFTSRIHFRFQITLTAIWMLLISLYFYNFRFDTPIEFVLSSLGRDTTLTGRIYLWDAVWRSVVDHFPLGVGYNGFWTGAHGLSSKYIVGFNWTMNQAHNGYLDVLNELGIFGLVMLLMILMQAIKRSYQLFRNTNAENMIFFLIILNYSITNISATSFCRQTFLGWIALVLALIATNPFAISRSVQHDSFVSKLRSRTMAQPVR